MPQALILEIWIRNCVRMSIYTCRVFELSVAHGTCMLSSLDVVLPAAFYMNGYIHVVQSMYMYMYYTITPGATQITSEKRHIGAPWGGGGEKERGGSRFATVAGKHNYDTLHEAGPVSTIT